MRTVLVALLALVVFVSASPTPPKVIEYFTSNLVYQTPASNQTGTIWYNGPGQSRKMTTFFPYPIAPWYSINTTTLDLPTSRHYITNQQCRLFDGKYGDWFAWVAYSTYVGVETVDDRKCDEWKYTTSSNILIMDVVAGTNIPVRYAIYGLNGALQGAYIFGSDLTTDFDSSVIFLPSLCQTNGFICPQRPVETMDMYRFHPASSYDLANHNTADLLGDVSYVCMTLYTSPTDTLISLFQVEVNTTYGQYGLCNGGVCVGGKFGTVGHAASGNMKDFCGQCRPNHDTGNWYSLTSESECPSNVAVGTNLCAWKAIKRVKTVSVDCLVSNNFEKSCLHDKYVPFSTATQVFLAAFNSTDPQYGGCPDVPPPASSSIQDSLRPRW